MNRPRKTSFVPALLLGMAALASFKFAFEAVQGDYGLFARLEAEAETTRLEGELNELDEKVTRMENLTRRLSDRFLDLDLLDQQARSILGLARADEVLVR